jgi:hypothetical protein
MGGHAMSIEVSKRRAVFSKLKPYCHHSGDNDYMEVTEWSNGEGFDIHIDRKRRSEKFSLTYGEWELLQVLINYKASE